MVETNTYGPLAVTSWTDLIRSERGTTGQPHWTGRMRNLFGKNSFLACVCTSLQRLEPISSIGRTVLLNSIKSFPY